MTVQPNLWRKLWEQWFNQDIVPWCYDTEQDAEFCIACGNNKEYGHDHHCILARAERALKQINKEVR